MKKVCADRQRTESVYTDTRKRERREKRGREERERLTFTAAKHHSQSIGKTWSSQIKKKTQKERKDKKERGTRKKTMKNCFCSDVTMYTRNCFMGERERDPKTKKTNKREKIVRIIFSFFSEGTSINSSIHKIPPIV